MHTCLGILIILTGLIFRNNRLDMINFSLQKLSGKWKKVSQFSGPASIYVDDYFRHFHEALLNLELNLQEERLRKKVRK